MLTCSTVCSVAFIYTHLTSHKLPWSMNEKHKDCHIISTSTNSKTTTPHSGYMMKDRWHPPSASAKSRSRRRHSHDTPFLLIIHWPIMIGSLDVAVIMLTPSLFYRTVLRPTSTGNKDIQRLRHQTRRGMPTAVLRILLSRRSHWAQDLHGLAVLHEEPNKRWPGQHSQRKLSGTMSALNQTTVLTYKGCLIIHVCGT